MKTSFYDLHKYVIEKFKYYSENHLSMLKICLKCDYKWNSSSARPKRCPNCKDELWDVAPSCTPGNVDFFQCDLCGYKWLSDLENPKRCPKCDSTKWNAASNLDRRLEVHPWVMEKLIGSKTYTYWMASWREGDKVRNVHLGSCQKMDLPSATEKARSLKAKALAAKL